MSINFEKKRGELLKRVHELDRSIDLLKKEKKSLMDELLSLDANIIYLVAPGYSGELPESDKLLSVVEFPNSPQIKVDNSRAALNAEYNIDYVFESDFETIPDFLNALSFVRLVIFYSNQPDCEISIICDDSRIMKLLNDQGIETDC